MKRKLIKRNKQFMSKLLKGKTISHGRGKYVFKRCVLNTFRCSKPYSPLKFNYTIWKFRRNK